ALSVGLNDPSHEYYGNAFERLRGAENDAISMQQIAGECGFETCLLLTARDATWAGVTSEIQSAAAALESGDIFLISYSGHGSELSPSWLESLGELPRSVKPDEWV